MTIEDAATALDKHRNSLYRLEAGETRLDVHLARSMMDVYDHYDPDLIDQVRDALKPGWWTAFGLRDMGYVDLETEASAVWEQALILLPGLLQTESYARAVLETGSLKRTKPELVDQVKVRMIRQQRLTSEADPLRLVALVDESALWQRIGGEAVMLDQLNHLVMVAELDTVTLRVLPRDLASTPVKTGHSRCSTSPTPKILRCSTFRTRPVRSTSKIRNRSGGLGCWSTTCLRGRSVRRIRSP